MRRRLESVPLLVRFGVLSTLSVACLGLVLGAVLAERIEKRALRSAERQAAAIARVGLGAALGSLEAKAGLGRAQVEVLDRRLAAGDLRALGVQRIKLFDRRGVLVYSDERADIGTRHDGDDLLAALAGQTVSERTTGVDHSGKGLEMLEVYVPVPRGAFELYLPYAPVAAEIRSETRLLYALVAGGLLLLLALLHRVVAGASRALRRQAEENRRQARADALTGLPNRTVMVERIAEAVSDDAARDSIDGLLLVDLDHFKDVNDTLGHSAGDIVLREVAERLRTVVRSGDTLARLGGDEFAVLVRNAPDRGVVAEVATRLADALSRPVAVSGLAVQLDASVGMALHPQHGTDAGALMKHADVAMYEAKRAGSGIETYRSEEDPYSEDRLALAGEIRRAISRDELVLHYQPIVEPASGRVRAVEALVRWEHPERGLLPPAEFIPLAERTGSIGPMTSALVDAALRQLRAWDDAGIQLGVAVNLAGPNVADADLPDTTARALRRWRIPPDRLCFEISERTVMADPGRVAAVLGRLAEMGVQLSLDDFGTGYSSLAYLKRLPITELKVDRSFVGDMTRDADDANIVASTLSLARSLGMHTVAEGVEDEETWEALATLRCDAVQGYWISRPLPAAELDAWLAGLGPGLRLAAARAA